MKGLLDVQIVRVPLALALDAHAHLRQAGRKGYEAFALWAGVLIGTTFEVRHTLIPQQTGHRLPSGVCVTVDAPELHRLNVWLYQNKVTLVAQLHSHPTEAYHSDTDDEYPIATQLGSLSLVIPNFAAEPFSLRRCAVYRLLPGQGWAELRPDHVEQLIQIVE
jgi:hypothetical protein